MSTMPREPRSRIILAVVLTSAIGGMFLAGEGTNQVGAPLSTAPADQRVAQQAGPPVATAPSPDDILTYTGRDPFDRDQKEKKSPQDSPAADPLTPAAQGVTSLAPGAGVTVSVGSAASQLSGPGSAQTSVTTWRDEDDAVSREVIPGVPQPDEPGVVDPVPVQPLSLVAESIDAVPLDDGGAEALARSFDLSGKGKPAKVKGKPAKGKGKPAKSKHAGVPPYQAYERAKEEPIQGRGHKKWSQPAAPPPAPPVGNAAYGWKGRGHAWGWKARCDGSHPSSKAGCRR